MSFIDVLRLAQYFFYAIGVGALCWVVLELGRREK